MIITIELHCSNEQQDVMARMIKEYLKGYLYEDTYDPMTQKYPTLNDLKRKILIRVFLIIMIYKGEEMLYNF